MVALAALGCAPAFPSFAGGRTVPQGRSDVAVGAAVRVPVGDLVDVPELANAAPGGAAPAAFVRHGVSRDVEIGAEVVGSSARLLVRGQVQSGLFRFVGGLAPHAGLADEDGGLIRLGGTLPLTLSIDVFSLYEVWIGLRARVDHVVGDRAGAAVSITGFAAGGVLGVGVGFRRLLIMLELGVDHELWTGDIGGISIERSGLVLTPAFAIRVRL